MGVGQGIDRVNIIVVMTIIEFWQTRSKMFFWVFLALIYCEVYTNLGLHNRVYSARSLKFVPLVKK